MDSSETPQKGTLTLEAFNTLLVVLGTDRDEAGREYQRLRKKLEIFFRIKGLAFPEKAADLTIDRLANLIVSKNEPVEDIINLALTVARYIFFEQIRLESFEDEAHGEFTEAHRLDGLLNSTREEHLNLQRKCFSRLTPDERRLLEEYYGEGSPSETRKRRKELAAKRGININLLRQHVLRARMKLEKIIEEEINFRNSR
ncbi:MAG TPA: hypothetical protein VEX64_11455 [Pyrinomonadaceae bacterium]|jgi:DNA-directed RNA polymerase specialized sigma24 family protein|nr:hypothetical protein [Pyrinomonadaceae bacterium]